MDENEHDSRKKTAIMLHCRKHKHYFQFIHQNQTTFLVMNCRKHDIFNEVVVCCIHESVVGLFYWSNPNNTSDKLIVFEVLQFSGK